MLAFSTAQPFCLGWSPKVVTYTVWEAWSTTTWTGVAPTANVGGGVAGQPARSVALQVALSSIETTVLAGPLPLQALPQLAMYTVWLAGSSNRASGAGPTGTVAGFCPQPEVSSALQVAPLNTDSVSSPRSVTYTVSVLTSTATPAGRLPTVMVGHGPLQREMSWALQCRSSITETVFPPAGGPAALLPLAT